MFIARRNVNSLTFSHLIEYKKGIAVAQGDAFEVKT
jgi:hypothetical protein